MPRMSDEERTKLIGKLNAEIEEGIAVAKAKNYVYKDDTDMFNTHPAFLDHNPTQEEIDENPLYTAMQDIKYGPDDNTPDELALAQKDDGNFHFKLKKYKTAVIAYTEGIKMKIEDKELICVLYSNRAAAHYHLQNFRSALLDAMKAVKLNPDRTKSLMRCAQCCNKLKRYKDAIDWCRVILSLDEAHGDAIELMEDSKKRLKTLERDARKQQLVKDKKKKADQMLLGAIKSRGVNLEVAKKEVSSDDEGGEEEDDILMLSSLEISSSGSAATRVHFDDDNNLIWPVMLVYPEHKTTDFVQAFNENSTFFDHLVVMFEQSPDWDASRNYKIENLEVFYENENNNEELCKVPVENTLKMTLADKKCLVRAGTPNFYVLSTSSHFYKPFLSKYKRVVEG